MSKHNGKRPPSKPMQLEEVYTKCDWCEHTKETTLLYIPSDIWAQWNAWTRVYPAKELLALFEAIPLDKNEGWHITKMWLPKQRVTAVECEILEGSAEANGMIHSHHHMAARMSTQDTKELLPAYVVSVVSNHAGEVEAYERVSLPCGGLGFKELEVLVDTAEDATAKAEVDAVLFVEEPKAEVVILGERRFGEHLNDAELNMLNDEDYNKAIDAYCESGAEFPTDHQWDDGRYGYLGAGPAGFRRR